MSVCVSLNIFRTSWSNQRPQALKTFLAGTEGPPLSLFRGGSDVCKTVNSSGIPLGTRTAESLFVVHRTTKTVFSRYGERRQWRVEGTMNRLIIPINYDCPRLNLYFAVSSFTRTRGALCLLTRVHVHVRGTMPMRYTTSGTCSWEPARYSYNDRCSLDIRANTLPREVKINICEKKMCPEFYSLSANF